MVEQPYMVAQGYDIKPYVLCEEVNTLGTINAHRSQAEIVREQVDEHTGNQEYFMRLA